MRDSLIVFVFFAVGVALGYADAVPTWLLDPDLPMIILSVMVVLVSLGLGAGDNLHYMPANAPGRATANKSRTFSQRPAEERVVWLGLLRRRLTARSSTGTPIREAIPSAI